MADAKMLKKVPVREQDPKVRATNFEEVCLGYNQEEAMEEAQRCLGCKKPKCVEGCPVSINIPGFIEHIKEGNMEEAYKVIGLSSALPAICGRVCPQESQCEGQCIRGKKGEAVSIGKLERFVADYALEHDIKPAGAEVKNGHKVAVIGSGPSGLTCAGDLAKAGYDVTVFEALHELGGVLVYGIPEFRLPKQKVVKKEIEKVKELGVKFETNVVIGKSTTIDQLMEATGNPDLSEGLPLSALGNREAKGKLYFQTGRLNVELPLPSDLKTGSGDNAILSSVLGITSVLKDHVVILVSKDINMRIKAATIGLPAEDYFNDKTIDDSDLLYSGKLSLPGNFWETHAKGMKSWQKDGFTWYRVKGPLVPQMLVNEFVYSESAQGGFEGIVSSVDRDEAVFRSLKNYTTPKNNVWGITARNSEQNFALNLLMNPEIDFVSLLGQAGTGKTLLTLAAALTQTLDERRYSEIIFTRATVSVGEDLLLI